MKKMKKQFSVDNSPLFISGIYIFISILWIIFSDKLAQIISGGSGELLGLIQTLKGGFFVLASGLMIFFLVKSLLRIIKAREYIYRILFESAGDSVFILDKSGILDCNTQTLKLFRYHRKEDFIGKTPWELSPPVQPDGRSSREVACEKINQALSGNQPVLNGDIKTLKGSLLRGISAFHLQMQKRELL